LENSEKQDFTAGIFGSANGTQEPWIHASDG